MLKSNNVQDEITYLTKNLEPSLGWTYINLGGKEVRVEYKIGNTKQVRDNIKNKPIVYLNSIPNDNKFIYHDRYTNLEITIHT